MNTDDSEFQELLAAFDPTGDDVPPSPGSARYLAILESAMNTETDRPTELSAERARHAKRTSMRLRVSIAAAAVLVIAIGAFIALSTNAPSAQATVSDAVSALGEVKSLEARLTTISPESKGTDHFRIDGRSYESKGETHYADGHVEASTLTVVDGIQYETIDGKTTRTQLSVSDQPAPFATASKSVLAAAMTGASVVDAGKESVGSTDTTRFDLKLGATSITALSKLAANEVAWFELEYPEQVREISLWVADGLIRQVEISQGEVTTTTTFTNFNGDVSVVAPSGPFVEGNGG